MDKRADAELSETLARAIHHRICDGLDKSNSQGPNQHRTYVLESARKHLGNNSSAEIYLNCIDKALSDLVVQAMLSSFCESKEILENVVIKSLVKTKKVISANESNENKIYSVLRDKLDKTALLSIYKRNESEKSKLNEKELSELIYSVFRESSICGLTRTFSRDWGSMEASDVKKLVKKYDEGEKTKEIRDKTDKIKLYKKHPKTFERRIIVAMLNEMKENNVSSVLQQLKDIEDSDAFELLVELNYSNHGEFVPFKEFAKEYAKQSFHKGVVHDKKEVRKLMTDVYSWIIVERLKDRKETAGILQYKPA